MNIRSVGKSVVVAITTTALLTTGVGFFGAKSAAAATSVVIDGHGFGHGRGLSQYGSLGYALAGRDHNWILQHYYSNTTGGSIGDGTVIGVHLENSVNRDMIVTSPSGFAVSGISYAANSAALVHKVGANTFDIYAANDCGGGGGWRKVATHTGDVVADPPTANPGDNHALMLSNCTTEGVRTYRGQLTMLDDGASHIVNNVRLGDYLRGVVPRESPASWADLGGGAGANALRAQSVAARSYAVSSPRARWTTCDTISCQVYGGAFLNGALIEDARTNAAVSATNGQVRLLNGAVARTEFSSSTGGWTAGGTYPAVVDDGDATPQNPNHNWSVSLGNDRIEAAYPSIGRYVNASITGRNGLGDWGGRVTSMSIVGTNGTVNTTGADFRARLGLKSDWFRISGVPSGGVDGYWLSAADGGIFTMGNTAFWGSAGALRLNRPVVGSTAVPHGNGYWQVASDGGIFTYGDGEFFGSMGGKPLNQPIVGMASTPSGKGYWLVASDGGIFSFGDAKFFGSMGGKPLNKPVVGMTSSKTGNGYALVASDGGIFNFGDSVFYGSTGSIRLNQPIVAMTMNPSGEGYWMVARDGGIFTYGPSTGFFGSLPGSRINGQEVVGMTPSATGGGYMIATATGNVFSYGDAPSFGGFNGSRSRIVSVMAHNQ